MRILVALEKYPGCRTQVWALQHPGLFCYGMDDSEALARFPQAVLAYQAWLKCHDPENWLKDLGNFDIRLVQTWEAYTIDDNFEESREGYEVNSFYRHDWKPLTLLDLQRAQKLLAWSREDLLAEVRGLTDEKLDQAYPDERWSIRGILKHVATAEWWYLTRLDLSPLEHTDLPEDVFSRLEFVRKLTLAELPGLGGMKTVLGKRGEFWSARKLIRRAVWHELDHVEHIRKLIIS